MALNLRTRYKRWKNSAKRRIEKTPKIKRLEMAWYKGKMGELRPAAVKREPLQVRAEKPQPGDRSLIHTHPTRMIRQSLLYSSQRSMGDWQNWLFRVFGGKIRNEHIAVTSPRGKVIGYVSVHTTNAFLRLTERTDPEASAALEGLMFKLIELHNQVKHRKRSFLPVQANLLKNLRDWGIVKVRYTAMPGYRWEKEWAQFVPAKQKTKK